MADQFEFSELMNRRRLTTSVAEVLKGRLLAYLNTFAPLLRPRAILGDLTRGSTEKIKGAEGTFEAIKESYLRVAGNRMFDLPKVLEPPIGIASTQPELSPSQYSYEVSSNGETKSLTITSPTKWLLTYRGLNEIRLKSLLAQNLDSVGAELMETLLHFSLMEAVIRHQTGIVEILSDLGYTVRIDEVEEYGSLPMVHVSCQVGTDRPSDDLLIQVSEVSGSPTFDELVRISDIEDMKTPIREQLLQKLDQYKEA
jgi:hypothetical protein